MKRFSVFHVHRECTISVLFKSIRKIPSHCTPEPSHINMLSIYGLLHILRREQTVYIHDRLLDSIIILTTFTPQHAL